jgi:hypothetical protein
MYWSRGESRELLTEFYSNDKFQFIYLQPPYFNASRHVRRWISRAIEDKLPPATRPDSPSEASSLLWDLFESCWELDPASRPDIESVMASHKHWHANYAHDLEQIHQGEGKYAAFSSSTTTRAVERQPDVSIPDPEETKVPSGPRSGSNNVDPVSPSK